jgi:hypothetical protein
MDKIVEKSKYFKNHSWNDLRNKILSIIAFYQEQYLLIDSKDSELRIIHFDPQSGNGLKNSNTLTISGIENGSSVDLKLISENNLNENLGISKAFSVQNSIDQLLEFLKKSFPKELDVSKKYSSNQRERILEIDTEITQKNNDLKFKRNECIILLGASILFLVLAVFESKYFLFSILLIALSIFLLLALIGFSIEFFSVKTDIENLQSKKNTIIGLPPSTEIKKGYFESLLEINIENLDSYYRMVKLQTAQSFKVSLILSSLGILLILAGLVFGFQNNEEEETKAILDKSTIAYISSGAGVLIEMLSGLLFYIYNKTVRQLKDYHDSLVNAQNIFLSFRLIDPIENNADKVALITKMIEMLNKKSETNSVN